MCVHTFSSLIPPGGTSVTVGTVSSLHHEMMPAHLISIQAFNGRIGLHDGFHEDEAKSTRKICLWIVDYLGAQHLSY